MLHGSSLITRLWKNRRESSILEFASKQGIDWSVVMGFRLLGEIPAQNWSQKQFKLHSQRSFNDQFSPRQYYLRSLYCHKYPFMRKDHYFDPEQTLYGTPLKPATIAAPASLGCNPRKACVSFRAAPETVCPPAIAAWAAWASGWPGCASSEASPGVPAPRLRAAAATGHPPPARRRRPSQSLLAGLGSGSETKAFARSWRPPAIAPAGRSFHVGEPAPWWASPSADGVPGTAAAVSGHAAAVPVPAAGVPALAAGAVRPAAGVLRSAAAGVSGPAAGVSRPAVDVSTPSAGAATASAYAVVVVAAVAAVAIVAFVVAAGRSNTVVVVVVVVVVAAAVAARTVLVAPAVVVAVDGDSTAAVTTAAAAEVVVAATNVAVGVNDAVPYSLEADLVILVLSTAAAAAELVVVAAAAAELVVVDAAAEPVVVADAAADF